MVILLPDRPDSLTELSNGRADHRHILTHVGAPVAPRMVK
jgi:hypothetical protein